MQDWKSTDPRPLPARPPTLWREGCNKAARFGLMLLATLILVKSWLDLASVEKVQGPDPDPVSSSEPFSWDQILPSEKLEYHNCDGEFQCARLEVPMDYEAKDPKARKFTLAIAKLPAKVPISDPRYGGAVLINPGGPGGRGTLQAFLSGRNLQTIVDAEIDPGLDPGSESESASDKYFDIIGFDPRGVGYTTPALTCFPDSVSQRNWELQVEAEGMLGSSPDALKKSWQRTQALNLGCSVYEMNAAHEDDSMMAYVNTPLVARDMLTIVERHGEWRENEGGKAQQAFDESNGYDHTRAIVKRTVWHRNEELLLYWGRSYGTVLGTTFAALFPDRVSRAVLDGVVNMDMFYKGEGPNAIVDADAIFDRFGLYCDAVGPDGCPFYVDGGPNAIKAAYWALEAQTLNASIPVMASSSRGPEVISWTDLKNILRVAVYQPLLAFPVLAEKVGALAQGNGVPMADFKHRQHFGACPSNECSIAGPWSSQCTQNLDNSLYAMSAILCTDAEHLANFTLESFTEFWQGLKKDSKALGDYWAQMQLACAGWKTRAKYPFQGILAQHPRSPLIAQHMSRQFPGSVLLQQDSEGHTTLAAPSLCVAKEIRNYFQNGNLPQAGTLCLADLKPLVGRVGQVPIVGQATTLADRELLQALIREVELGYLP
ncbi:hypothetical protein N7478_005832 [Penicillium angulare]|uniref:uncharacterized protein n=1 Tax=Penicillium angulare TaxID=116970 RepID=UPI0025423BC6|nr:uncharacterized protein N7478_005832 [Penicillium angulare]KAJ5280460.1 hypothetical protein N7478_005832 [Penicillium angulare]